MFRFVWASGCFGDVPFFVIASIMLIVEDLHKPLEARKADAAKGVAAPKQRKQNKVASATIMKVRKDKVAAPKKGRKEADENDDNVPKAKRTRITRKADENYKEHQTKPDLLEGVNCTPAPSSRTRQSRAASSSGAKPAAKVVDSVTTPTVRDPPQQQQQQQQQPQQQNWYTTAADNMLRGVLPERYARASLSADADKDPPRRWKKFDAASIPDAGVPLRTWPTGSVPVCPWPTQRLQTSQTPPRLAKPTVEATPTAMPRPVIDKTRIEPHKPATVDKSILEKHTKVRSERRTSTPTSFSDAASTTMLPEASAQLADAPKGKQLEWTAGFDRDRFEGYRRPKKAPKQEPEWTADLRCTSEEPLDGAVAVWPDGFQFFRRRS